MAITINGSGTITGISAGGLPDGSVTAADLASGAITSGALPSGTVIQTVYNAIPNDSGRSTTATSWTATGIYVDITPTNASNILICSYSASMAHAQSGAYGSMAMFKDGSNMGGSWNGGYINRNYDGYQPFICRNMTIAGSTSSQRFEMYVQTNGTTIEYVHVNSSYALIVQEVVA